MGLAGRRERKARNCNLLAYFTTTYYKWMTYDFQEGVPGSFGEKLDSTELTEAGSGGDQRRMLTLLLLD